MNFSWIILASLLTSCALSAPPLHHDKKPNPHSQDPNTKQAELENVAEEELTLRLEQIVAQAELELKEMEVKAEAFQAIHGTPNSNSLTLEKLLLLTKLQQTIKQENTESDITKLLLAQMLPLDSSLSPEQLLLLSRLSGGQDHRSSEQHDDDLLKKDFYEGRNQDEMSLEQKVLEASLLQGLEMNHEQLLRLAELRAQRSGASTLQELFLVHHRSASLTPEQILVLKSFTSSQILKYYHLLNGGSSSFDHGRLGSLINQLSDLARTKVILENTELMLSNLLKNRNPHEGKLSLAELVVINRYQEAMTQSIRRTRFILMMHMMNMSNDMDSQDDDRTPQQQKMMLAAMIHRMTQQMNEKWDKEEALLLMRYRQGKATLMGTLMAYKRLNSMMNSGLGSDLRKIVMNEIRTNMVKGSGIGMMRNGSWMNGWMNNMQWMNASDSDRMNELWELYKLRFVRNFNSKDHERSRRRNFENKLPEIVLHEMDVKLGRQLFSMAPNNLTDWSKEELSTLKGFNKTLAEDDYMAQQADVAEGERARTVLPAMPIYTNTVPTSQLPTYVNWTTTGWVGPIQNQGQCGSCWSFSAAGSLEAQYYNKTGTFVTMSEQNLIDCTYYLGNLGCSGGHVELAFDYVMTVGIDTYASYPYTGRANNGVCKYDANNSVTQDVGWRLIPEGNELALQQAVALTGPVSVAIDASLSSFDSYTHGVYSPVMCSTTQLDHAVLVVGYGTYEGQDYWLIKNSWGTDWGIYGYMMMERGVNMCGIATAALFPVID